VIGKVCAAPRGGGSAKGAVEYILCYSTTQKGASREDQLIERDALYAEALSRDDMGAGAIWSPESGHGIRPSSIYAHGVSSLASAALEMQAVASANPRVREAATHIVISLGDGIERSDAEFVAGVRDVLAKIGAGDLQYVVAVHRDTGNLHAHVAVGNVHPITHQAWDRTQLHSRLSRAEREVEIDRGWEHDRGIYVVRDEGLLTERIDRSTRAERRAWKGERRAHAHETRRFEMYETREQDFTRYVDASVAPRMRSAIDRDEEATVPPSWSEMHLVAERYGARISLDKKTGAIQLIEQQAPEDQPLIRIDGARVNLGEHIGQEHLDKLGEYLDREQAEVAFADALTSDPGIVSRRLSLESSTIDADDMARYIGTRVEDAGEIERLVEHVQHADSTLRLLSADGEQPVYTTAEIDVIEGDLATRFDPMANARDEAFDQAALDKAIAKVERRGGITLDDEQRSALGLLRGKLAVIEAPAGSGKTTIMAAATIYAAATNRDIVGITIGQAAADRLTAESGMRAMNSALALSMEASGNEVIPHGGIVTIEEAGMADSRTFGWIVRTAQERGTQVFVIGDTGQLQPVAAGAAMRMATEATQAAGQYAGLRNIHRHSNAWHRDVNLLLSDGIHERDEEKIESALKALDKYDAITFASTRDDTIDEAVRDYLAVKDEGKTALIVASDRDTVRHLNEQIRSDIGMVGGAKYATANGTRELLVGDRFIFRENSRRMKVLNGTTGEVVDTGKKITIKTDDGKLVKFDPTEYQQWDHGYATTVYSAQGATVDAVVGILDPSASAELAYVAITRARHSVSMYAAKTNFAGIDDLAEHIADRIRLKTTSRTFDELLTRTGGPDNIVAVNARAQQDALNHPLRPEYEQSEARKSAQRTKLVKAANTRAKGKIAALAGMPLADIIEARKKIIKQQRREVLSANKRHAPTDFGAFVHDATKTTSVTTTTPHVTTPPATERQTMNAPINQPQTQAQREAKLKAQQAAKRKPVAMAPFMPSFARGGGIGARSGGSSPSIPLTPGDEHRRAMAHMHGSAGKHEQALHLSQLQRNWKTPAKATAQATTTQMPQAKTSQSQAKPAQVPQARLTPGQPASDAKIKAAREAYLSHQRETMIRVDGVWRDKPQQAQSQAAPQAKPAQPKTRREPPVALNGKPVSAARVPWALDALKAKGERQVAVSGSPAQKPGVFRAMAGRGMSLPPAQQRTADGPVFRAASQQVASQRASANPRVAATMKSAAQSQTSAKAAQQAPAPAPRQAQGRSR